MAFRDIIGQEQAVNILKNALMRDRLPHSLLFTGPEGTGKRLTGLALAMELNCAEPEGAEACGKCPDCRQISKSSHPDVSIVSPEGKALEIKIDSVRALRREMHLEPVRGRYKISLIDRAEKLNSESANALLKVLEEPPARSLIMLVTPEPYSLLPTIISRCQTVKFKRLSVEDTEKVLRKNPDITQDNIPLLAKLSEGSPGKAASLVRGGPGRRREILDWAFPEGRNSPGILEILKTGEEKAGLSVKETSEKRENLLMFLEILLSWFSDALVSSAGGENLTNEDYSERIKKYAAAVKTEGAAGAMKILLQAQEQVRLFANPKLVFESAMAAIAKAGQGAEI
jgi:DNA polymerase III subunit delta'